MLKKKIDKAKKTIHLAGILLNGFIQGTNKEKLNSNVLLVADK